MTGLIRAGDSRRAAAARAMNARRREQWGPSICSPAGVERKRAANARQRRLRVTHCVHGHRYTDANTYINTQKKRVCRACKTLRYHRARWAAFQAHKLARLKAAMIRAHPDVGGTTRRFIRARTRYLQARDGRPCGRRAPAT
jgi:rubrerythrin